MKAFGRRREGTAVEAAVAPSANVIPMPQREETGLQDLRREVMERVDPVAAMELSSSRLQQQVEALVHEIANGRRLELSAVEQARIAVELTHEMVGHGPLEPLLADDAITDIMVNGPDKVFIEKRGRLVLSDVRFRSGAQLSEIAQKMAAAVGRRVDESSPMVDCRLPDGSRVNIVMPPLALDGACISIRKFPKRRIGFAEMVENGSLSPPVARVLEIAARGRLNIVISGGTGSGKTTMMNAMSRLIDHGERVVTIEDAAELQLQQPHVVRLETRPGSIEGRGEITQRDLIKNALRMRPDRIIVGEVRGAEAFDMLQAMNTGYDGSICTVHANTTRDAVTRIENMVQMGSMALPVRAIRTQIASAVDIIVQIERMRDGVRRVAQVSEVCGLEGDVITMNDVFAFEFEGEGADGRLQGRWVGAANRPSFIERLRYFGLDRAWMEAVGGA